MTTNHNKYLLQGHNNKKKNTRQCKTLQLPRKSKLPIEWKMFSKMCIYKATVTETTTENQESYIGLTDNEFKTRYNQHKWSFKLVHRKKDTRLREHIWELKDRNIEHTIQGEIMKKKPNHIHQKKACANFVWKRNIKC